MKRYSFISYAVVFTWFCVLNLPPGAAATRLEFQQPLSDPESTESTELAVLEGIVIALGTGIPLPDAGIKLLTVPGLRASSGLSVRTADDGTFLIESIPEG